MQGQRDQFSHEATVDLLPVHDAMSEMLASHIAALEATRSATSQIADAACAVAGAIEAGATIHYAAAGSSGLMALADACELPGTFQISPLQLRVSMAGGVPVDGIMPGDTEDGEEAAVQAAAVVEMGDVAIVVSASGTTPYALAFANAAKTRGAQIIGIANVAQSTLLKASDIPVALNTGREVVEGSTRLAAGTAQKVALNMISTQVGILLGHVHEGLMVNLHADNSKLRRRAIDIVSRIARVAPSQAEQALRATSFNTKSATLVALGASEQQAETLLGRHHGHLQRCLQDADIQSKIATSSLSKGRKE